MTGEADKTGKWDRQTRQDGKAGRRDRLMGQANETGWRDRQMRQGGRKDRRDRVVEQRRNEVSFPPSQLVSKLQ